MDAKKKNSILVADDNPNNLKVIHDALSQLNYDVRIAQDGQMALESIQLKKPDLIILDIHMPILDGYEVCKRIKADNKYKDIPVIFSSALNDEFNKVKAFEYGAIDYICKPVQIEEVRARVSLHVNSNKQREELLQLTSQLEKQKNDLEVFNSAMIGREMRIIELKKEVNALAVELGREKPYKSVEE